MGSLIGSYITMHDHSETFVQYCHIKTEFRDMLLINDPDLLL